MNANVEIQGHFKGVAVVIDDEIGTDPGILGVIESIEAGGGRAVKLDNLPQGDLENFAGVAFFIMDWHLAGGQGVILPPAVAEAERARKLAFLESLRTHRHAPVFIFTNERLEDVRAELEALGPSGAHILVRSKAEVAGRVYEELNQWAAEKPSVLALKGWERQNRRAINSLFNDLHDHHHYWPVILWETFKLDSIPAKRELGQMISRLVAARTEEPNLDLDGFLPRLSEEIQRDDAAYKRALLGVLESERFLRNDRLDHDSFTTGDVFLNQDDGAETYWLNIRAECDCIRREAGTPTMLLLKGQVVPDDEIRFIPKSDAVIEQDNEAIVYAMYEGKHISFRFKSELRPKDWSGRKGWQSKRIGRLLPPFLTRLLQRYAAYSQRPGLPRVPQVLIPSALPSDAASIEPTPSVPARPDGAAEA